LPWERTDWRTYCLRKEDEYCHNGGTVVVTLAGGYAYDVNDTVTIHANTAKEVLSDANWYRG